MSEMAENAQSGRRVVNIDEVPLHGFAHSDTFEARIARIGPMIGSGGLGCSLIVVPAGKRAFPFHNHHVVHEMFFILAGSGEYRYGDANLPIRAGDVLAAPAGGPETAHQIVNTGDTELRYLGFSDSVGTGPEVVEYPDSNKFAFFSHSPDASPLTARVRYVGRVENSLEYWDGE